MKYAWLAFLTLSCAVGAQEYRCKEEGRTVLTNLPCKAGSKMTATANEENKTAQEIQREFEESVRRERELKAQQERQETGSSNDASDLAVTPEPEIKPPPPTIPREKSNPTPNIFSWMLMGPLIYFVPSIIAGSRRSKRMFGIIALNVFLGWTLIGWIVALVWAAASDGEEKPTKNAIELTQAPVDVPVVEDSTELRRIKEEVSLIVAAHEPAVELMQALARLDGVTTKAERSVMIDFLNRQGGRLDERHHGVFYGYRAREWSRGAEDDELDAIMAPLRDKPLMYRVDLVAASTAIVATGGTAKKRESIALDKIRTLITG